MFLRAAVAVVLFSPFSAVLAFQSSGPAVSVQPRVIRQAPRPEIPQADLRVDSSLVLVPVHVTTVDGASVTNLNRENFQVSEDGIPQKITYFTKEDAPLSIGLLFDTSGSMHNKIRKSSEAAATFFKTANAEDEFFLIEFSDRAKLTVPFTRDSDEIYKRIAHVKPFGRTSLLDAIHLALLEMRNAHNPRKAIVIVSDGGDNRSRYTEAEVRNAMLESDVQLYAMGIFDPEDKAHKLTPEERFGPYLLDELAAQTGGRNYPVDSLDDLPSISTRISEALRDQYLIGYPPSNASRDGKYRRIVLKLTLPPDLSRTRVYYRRGYYAPVE